MSSGKNSSSDFIRILERADVKERVALYFEQNAPYEDANRVIEELIAAVNQDG